MHRRMKHAKILPLVGVLLVSLLFGVRVVTAVEVGDQAPDFSLPSTTGGKVGLSEFRGKKHVLLEFYVADFGGT